MQKDNNTVKHTGGEWSTSLEYGQELLNGLPIIEVQTDFTALQNVFPEWIAKVRGNSQQEAEKNAKLIAAAPDLLEALKEALNIIDRMGDEYRDLSGKHDSFTNGEHKRLTAAINKATE